MKRRLRDAPAAVLMLGASLTLLGVWTIYPLIRAIQTGHLSCDQTGRKCTEKGWGQYLDVFQSKQFQDALMVSVKLAVMTVPIGLLLGIGLAVLADKHLRGIGFFRTAYYIPSILGSSVAIAVLWRALFAIDGLLNSFIGVLGFDPVNWLGEPSLALMSVTLLRVWQFGSAMVIFLAALQNVPQSQYEAAMIDGASKWQMFMKVTVPLITPVIFFNFIMQTTQAFQEFTGPYVITGGGPTYSTYLFSLYIYDTAFKYFDMGYGAALAWVLFLVVAVFAAIAFKSSKYWVFYSADKGGKNG